MDTDKIFFNMGRVSLEKTLSQWNELYSHIKGSSIFVKKITVNTLLEVDLVLF